MLLPTPVASTTNPAPTLTLYYAPGACSLAPHILLRMAGLPFTAVSLPVTNTRIAFPPTYHFINPKLRVPALTLDTATITEVPALAATIAALAPAAHLYGHTALDAARVAEWLAWLATSVHSAGFAHLFRPGRWSAEEGAWEGIRARARECVREGFEFMEGRLGEGWAVGEGMTAVEPYLLVFYRWGREGGFEMRERYPTLTALMERVARLEAVREALEVEGLGSMV